MTDLNHALRSLDPSSPALDDSQRRRAAATLERIVMTDPGLVTGGRSTGAIRRRRGRLALAGVTAGALALVAVDITGSSAPAYASWSASPSAVTERDTGAAARECRQQLAHTHLDVSKAALVLAERRGEYLALLYRTENPDMSGACLARVPAGTGEVLHIESGAGGSSGPAPAAAPGSYTQGTINEFHGASITDGAVGAGVSGVTIHAGTYTLHASVRGGRYVAWWPGPAFGTDSSGEPRVLLTYDLTLDDGAVLSNVQPTRPS